MRSKVIIKNHSEWHVWHDFSFLMLLQCGCKYTLKWYGRQQNNISPQIFCEGRKTNSVDMEAWQAWWLWTWRALREQWMYIQAGFVRPPQHCQASHILHKYALLRSFTQAFSPVRSPQILISQVTVVGFKPVCAADITVQASKINLRNLSLHFQ